MTDSVSYYLIAADGQKHQIHEPTILVGRKNATCQFVIENSEISREHARLRVTTQGLEVKDLSSANGTFVGNQRVRTKRTLKNGDQLKFGPLTYTVVIEGSNDLDETVVGLDVHATAPPQKPAPEKTPSVIDVMPSKQRLHPAWMDGESQVTEDNPAESKNQQSTQAEPADSIAREPQDQKIEESERKTPAAEPTGSNAPPATSARERPDTKEQTQKPAKTTAKGPADETEDNGKAGTIEVMPLKQNIPPAWRDEVSSETAILRPDDLAKLEESQSASFNDFDQLFDQQFDGPTLLILSGKEAGRPFRLHCSADICFWTIGKGGADINPDDEISIAIDDYSVSNFHAKLVYRHGRWKIVDQMSTNHTYVNDEQHNAAFLSSGDFIRFGRVKARFLLPQEIPVDEPAPSKDENKPALARMIKKLFKK